MKFSRTKHLKRQDSPYFGNNITLKQAIELSASIIFTILPLISAFIQHNNHYFVITVFFIIFFSATIWHSSFIFEIHVSKDIITCKNLYQSKVLSSDEFELIAASKKWIFPFILFPSPSPPYFVFKFRDGREYIFIDSSKKAFRSIFKTSSYINELNKQVKSVTQPENYERQA